MAQPQPESTSILANIPPLLFLALVGVGDALNAVLRDRGLAFSATEPS